MPNEYFIIKPNNIYNSFKISNKNNTHLIYTTNLNSSNILIKTCNNSALLVNKKKSNVKSLIKIFHYYLPNISHIIYNPNTFNKMEKRYKQTQLEFPNFDLNLIENKSFILVSFGSVAKVIFFLINKFDLNTFFNLKFKVEFMPKKLLNIFFLNFEKSDYNIIWQTNSDPSKILLGLRKRLPSNIFMYHWLPLKILLGKLAKKNLFFHILNLYIIITIIFYFKFNIKY